MICKRALQCLALALTQAGTASAGAFYSGFEAMQHLFVFGASLDSTDVPGTFIFGVTTAYGPNIPRYLTSDFDKIRLGPQQVSNMALHNFASPGATTDTNIIPSSTGDFGPVQYTPRDWTTQVGKDFWDNWTSGGVASGWTSSNALFIFTASNAGNDILNGFKYSDRENRRKATMQVMKNRFNQLYNAGARNFVWLEVPPADLVPRHNTNPSEAASLKQYGDDWQAGLNTLKKELLGSKSGVTFWQPSTRQQTRDIVSNPGQFGYTNGYRDTTGRCPQLENQGYTP